MSHELRTPLNAIIGFSQLLEHNPSEHLSGNQRESVSHIHKSGQHLLELINEILDLSQIEARKLSLAITPMRLDLVICEAVELVQAMAGEYDVNVVTEISGEAETEIFVVADHLRLRQILLNLLSNGIKYNNPGGSVSIHVVSDEEMHRVVVRDTGIGIEEKSIENLFQPFNRLGAEAKNIEGTGIGLTITKRLVEVMNGEIRVTSVPGEGSEFTVVLPAGERKAEISTDHKENEKKPAVEATKDKLTTVLYVEDNYYNIMLVQGILALRPESRLVIAKSGIQGIKLAAQELPSLILMDINLPDISGIAALAELMKNEVTANIPVIAVSADAMVDVVKEREMAGFRGYITKPFMIDEFLGVIDAYVGEDPPRRADYSLRLFRDFRGNYLTERDLTLRRKT
jgi:CheY-like chemotaxis protein